jgi:hypothetical protein
MKTLKRIPGILIIVSMISMIILIGLYPWIDNPNNILDKLLMSNLSLLCAFIFIYIIT